MNAAHEDQKLDAAKKRRGYLAKKASIFTFSLASGAVAAVCVLLACILFFLAPASTVALKAFLAAIFSGLAFIAARQCSASLQESRSLPYVPPAAEQIAALPAGEVLVRGAAEPVAEPGELLRADCESEITPADELLRPDRQAEP